MQTEDGSIVRLNNPNALEREAADSVLLRCRLDDGAVMIKTIKPGKFKL